jgi:hypothetical protein
MLAETDTQASRALSALGITAEALQEALAAVPVSQTSDAATPPQTVAVTIGGSTTVVVDADIAAALQQMSPDQLREAMKRAVEPAAGDDVAG